MLLLSCALGEQSLHQPLASAIAPKRLHGIHGQPDNPHGLAVIEPDQLVPFVHLQVGSHLGWDHRLPTAGDGGLGRLHAASIPRPHSTLQDRNEDRLAGRIAAARPSSRSRHTMSPAFVLNAGLIVWSGSLVASRTGVARANWRGEAEPCRSRGSRRCRRRCRSSRRSMRRSTEPCHP